MICNTLSKLKIRIGLFLGLMLAVSGLHAQTIKLFLNPGASAMEQSSADELAMRISECSGRKVVMERNVLFTGEGIYLTTVAQDRYKKLPRAMTAQGVEGVYINSNTKGVYLAGNSALAVQHAVFIYLEKLGYRFYLPNKAWHIIPKGINPYVKYEWLGKPAYEWRQLYIGYSEGSQKAKDLNDFWMKANRLGGAFGVNAAHSYYEIVQLNQKLFEQHPEYLTKPLVNGQIPPGGTFNFASKELVELVANFKIKQIRDAEASGQPINMVTLSPVDGDNTCNTPGCKKLGSTSDQVFYFTNEVAKRIKKVFPDKWVGVDAYHDHSVAPAFAMENNIYVSIANGFNQTNTSTSNKIRQWSKVVKKAGIYDYLNVYGWNFDMPGRPCGARPECVQERIRGFYKDGARVYIGEQINSWVNGGLGFYAASKLFWDPNSNIGLLQEEFMKQCFPASQKQMRQLFSDWQNYKGRMPMPSDMKRWLEIWFAARRAANTALERTRIDHIGSYIQYIILYFNYEYGPPSARKENLITLLALLRRELEEDMLPSWAAIIELSSRSSSPELLYNAPQPLWQARAAQLPSINAMNTLSLQQLEGAKQIDERIRSRQQISRKQSGLDNKPRPRETLVNRGEAYSFYGPHILLIDLKESEKRFFEISTGRLPNSKLKGMVEIFPWNESLIPVGAPVAAYAIEPDQQMNKIDLSRLPPGKYLIRIDDYGNESRVKLPDGLKGGFLAREGNLAWCILNNDYYFFVPEGTDKFYIINDGYIEVKKPDGSKTIYTRENGQLLEIRVEKGQQGWWKILLQVGEMGLIGVPPLLTPSPDHYFWLNDK